MEMMDESDVQRNGSRGVLRRYSCMQWLVIVVGIFEIVAACGIIFSGTDTVRGVYDSYTDAQAKATDHAIQGAQLDLERQIATTEARQLIQSDPLLATQIAQSISPLQTRQAMLQRLSQAAVDASNALEGEMATEAPEDSGARDFGEPYRSNGIVVYVLPDIALSNEKIQLSIKIVNERSSQYLLRFHPDVFELSDDLGTTYPFEFAKESDRTRTFQEDVPASGEFIIGLGTYPGFPRVDLGYFRGPIPSDAELLSLHVSEIAGLHDLSWTYDLR
jgi:hypothetical protein